jgi:hypothetical protein
LLVIAARARCAPSSVCPAVTATTSASVAPEPHALRLRNKRELMMFAPDPNDTARDGLAIDILRPTESDS